VGRSINLVTPLLAPGNPPAETPDPTTASCSRSSRVRPRLRLARALGRSAAALSRTTRLGSGTTIGGRVALVVEPGALAQLGRGRVLACVTGTNGKTTTTRLLSAALRASQPLLSNTSGANLASGLVAALCRDLRADAVLEVDELYLGSSIAELQPRVVVLLNLTRDQLDRMADVQRVAQNWRSGLRAAGSSAPPLVVANCDDPRVVWAARKAPSVHWVAAGRSWTDDAHVCPHCGHPIQHRSAKPDAADGSSDWFCSFCTLRRPTPDTVVSQGQLTQRNGTAVPITLRLPGRANQGNAAMAAVAAAALGVPLRTALASMSAVAEIEGRYAEYSMTGRRMRLLLAKNPAGWAETMDLILQQRRPLLLSVNARPVDGRDTSWLYDVPFERLAGRAVTVTGAAGADLSLRLDYAGVPHQALDSKRAAVEALRDCIGASGHGPAVGDVVGDYSSFRQLRRMVSHG
jgi:UDP-N-acetylmuramyl tripeptide synthase